MAKRCDRRVEVLAERSGGGGAGKGGGKPSPAGNGGAAEYRTPYRPKMSQDVNPGGGTKNCGPVACAGDSTLGGNPTSAPADDNAMTRDEFETFIGGGLKFVQFRNLNAVVAEVQSWGSGARGIVGGWPSNGPTGHYFNVVNRRVVVEFYDFQRGWADTLGRWGRFYLMRTTP